MSKALKIQNPGFFMLELLVSMAIMSIVWLMIARYQGVAIITTHNAQQRMRAVSMASNLLDAALSQKQFVVDTQKKEIDGFTVTWQVRPRALVPTQSFLQYTSQTKVQFNLLSVNVAWSNNNHTQSIQLTSGAVLNKEAQ